MQILYIKTFIIIIISFLIFNKVEKLLLLDYLMFKRQIFNIL